MNWKPLRNNIIIKPLNESAISKGGIHIPVRSQSEKREGMVVRISNSYEGEVKVGDKVLYNYMSGEVIWVDKEKYKIVPISVLLGIIEE